MRSHLTEMAGMGKGKMPEGSRASHHKELADGTRPMSVGKWLSLKALSGWRLKPDRHEHGFRRLL